MFLGGLPYIIYYRPYRLKRIEGIMTGIFDRKFPEASTP
jgi:hypothetical protein